MALYDKAIGQPYEFAVDWKTFGLSYNDNLPDKRSAMPTNSSTIIIQHIVTIGNIIFLTPLKICTSGGLIMWPRRFCACGGHTH